MNLRAAKLVPVLIAAAVVGLILVFQIFSTASARVPLLSRLSQVFEELEWKTYDWRVRMALKRKPPVADNLAAVFIGDTSLTIINEAYGFSWPWPRFLHGQIVEELSDQGARVVGFDILFRELHSFSDDISLDLPDGRSVGSDAYFGVQLAAARNIILAAMGETESGRWSALFPAELFGTNALAVGHITSEADADGVLRRAMAYRDDAERGRIWHLAILMAGQALGLDVENAEVRKNRIIFRGPGGVERVLPTDSKGFFYINWVLRWNDPRLTQLSSALVLRLHWLRRHGTAEQMEEFIAALREEGLQSIENTTPFRDKVVVIGSIGSGNNIADIGTTPIDKDTFLVGKHWNIANAILTGDFIRRSGLPLNAGLILVFGTVAALLTWRMRALTASLCVFALASIYTVIAAAAFIHSQYWLPLVLPVGGALLMTHICMVTYRVVFEQNERRRVKAVFSRIVSPDVVNELLSAERLNLGGARRRMTVFFADVRGFTQMTDDYHAKAEEYVRARNLKPDEANVVYDEQARQTLETVNTYLATIADRIKEHDGTLDKYMGDCVMAFWGAPVPNEQHALACVRAAIAAQRAIHELNQTRFAENKRREAENARLAADGEPPLPLLPLLSLGTGINSGEVIVGLMGSDDHLLNYTVFGREVNLASRLEGVSGRGRIIISEATYIELQRLDPALAATCVGQPAVTVKGIREAVKIFEVPWKTAAPPESPPAAGEAQPEPKPSANVEA